MTTRQASKRRCLAAVLAALIVGAALPAWAASPVTLTYEDFYTFAPTCDLSKPLAFIHLVAGNPGLTSTDPVVITATEAAGTLGGSFSLPRLAARTTQGIVIPLSRLGSANPAALGGSHQIIVSTGTTSIVAILPFPAALCKNAPTPPPKPSGFNTSGASSAKRNLSALVLTVAAPANVRSVAAGTDCGAHVGPLGALVCPDMMKSGDLLLIWDWQAGNGLDTIDGYRIYRVGHGTENRREAALLVATQTNKLQTLFDLPKPKNGSAYDGLCYVVTAYAGAKESPRSSPYCASSTSSAKTVTLTPIRDLSVSRIVENGHEKSPVIDSRNGFRAVGHIYMAHKGGVLADSSSAVISRYAMLFNMQGLIGHRLIAAQLTVKILVGYIAESSPDCTNSAGAGTVDWWKDDSWPDAAFGDSPITQLPTELHVDATRIVQIWMAGRFNQGIVLRNDDENFKAFTNLHCETYYYGNPVLSITYY